MYGKGIILPSQNRETNLTTIATVYHCISYFEIVMHLNIEDAEEEIWWKQATVHSCHTHVLSDPHKPSCKDPSGFLGTNKQHGAQ